MRAAVWSSLTVRFIYLAECYWKVWVRSQEPSCAECYRGMHAQCFPTPQHLGVGRWSLRPPNASKQLSMPPSSRTTETFAKFTSVLLVTLLLTQAGTLGGGLNQLNRANFCLHIFIKSNFKGSLRVELLTPTSRTKCWKRDLEEGDIRGISKETYPQECVLLSFVF